MWSLVARTLALAVVGRLSNKTLITSSQGFRSVLPVHREGQGLNCIRDVLKDDAIAILKEFYDQENETGK